MVLLCDICTRPSHIDATLRPLDCYDRRKALYCPGQLIYAQSGVSAYSEIDEDKRPRVLNSQTYSTDDMIHHIVIWQCRDRLYHTKPAVSFFHSQLTITKLSWVQVYETLRYNTKLSLQFTYDDVLWRCAAEQTHSGLLHSPLRQSRIRVVVIPLMSTNDREF